MVYKFYQIQDSCTKINCFGILSRNNQKLKYIDNANYNGTKNMKYLGINLQKCETSVHWKLQNTYEGIFFLKTPVNGKVTILCSRVKDINCVKLSDFPRLHIDSVQYPSQSQQAV